MRYRRALKPFALLVAPLLERLLEWQCRLAARWASFAHGLLFRLQWAGWRVRPEHWDHRIDLYYGWRASRNSLWVERGVFGTLALKGGSLLEICCGDGYNARHFYSLRSTHVLACDFDPAAIRTARRVNAAPNVTYILADIRTAMPSGIYSNVVWDSAIAHFTPEEIRGILVEIKARLAPEGILTGCTIVEAPDGQKSLPQHEYEFKSKDDLLRFLVPHFRHALVFETLYPDRHNLYFWASDGPIPFQEGWGHHVVSGGPPCNRPA